jgi:hypothetical protein
MIVDYVHKRKFPILSPILTWTLRSATVGVLVGVYQFNTNDIGAINAARHFFSPDLFPKGLTELTAKVWAA